MHRAVWRWVRVGVPVRIAVHWLPPGMHKRPVNAPRLASMMDWTDPRGSVVWIWVGGSDRPAVRSLDRPVGLARVVDPRAALAAHEQEVGVA